MLGIDGNDFYIISYPISDTHIFGSDTSRYGCAEHAARTEEMTAVIGIVRKRLIGHSLTGRCVDELACAVGFVNRDHQRHMSDIASAAASRTEEQKVARLKFVYIYALALCVLAARGALKIHAKLTVYPAGKSRAVKSMGTSGAKAITGAEEFRCIINHLACKDITYKL